MARMTAARAAVEILKREGVTQRVRRAGCGDQPLLRGAQGVRRHQPHARPPRRGRLAHGRGLHPYEPGQHRRLHRYVGPGRHRHDHRPLLGDRRLDPDPVHHRARRPTAVIHKEDFQAVDIASIAKPVTKMAVTVLEAAQVPGVFQQAFHLMRSGRPGPVLIDLPIDVQLTEIEFDPETYEPLPVYKPAATRAQIEKAIALPPGVRAPADRRRRRHHQRRRLRPPGRVRRADRHPGRPDPHGLGHPSRTTTTLNAGMVGLQTSTATATRRSWSRTSSSASATAGPTATPASWTCTREGRTFVHVDIEPTQIGKIFAPDYGIASDAKAALELFVEVARELKAAGKLPDRSAWAASAPGAQGPRCSAARTSTTCR